MKNVKVELLVPDDKICRLPLLKRYIKRKLSAEYYITVQPRVGESKVCRSKGFYSSIDSTSS